MAEVNNSLALGIKPAEFDITKPLEAAAKINSLNASTAQTQQQTQYNQFQQDQNGGYRANEVNTLAEANTKRAGLAGQIGNILVNDPSSNGVRQALDIAKRSGIPVDAKTEQHLLSAHPQQIVQYGQNMQRAGQSSTTNIEQNPGQIDARNAAAANAAKRGGAAGELGVATPSPIPVTPTNVNSAISSGRNFDGSPRVTSTADVVSPYATPGSLSSAAAEVGSKSAMAKDALEQSQKSYNSAMDLKARIPDIAHDIEVLGPSWMGAGADTKTKFAKGWNGVIDTAAGILGVQPNAKMQFDPRKVATAEEFAKEQTRAGMALLNSNFGAGREAASIVQMGRAAVAGQSNTYLGAKYVLATIEAVADRQAALHEFKMTDTGPLQTAEIRFNKMHPPQEFTYQSIAKNLPQGAIQDLSEHPKLKKEFDDHYKVPGLGEYLLTGKP